MSLRFHKKKKKKTDLVSIDVYGSLYLKNISITKFILKDFKNALFLAATNYILKSKLF
jgi:hypothetical protein